MLKYFQKLIKKLKISREVKKRGGREKINSSRKERISVCKSYKTIIFNDLLIGVKLKEINMLEKDEDLLRSFPSYNKLLYLHLKYRGFQESEREEMKRQKIKTRWL